LYALQQICDKISADRTTFTNASKEANAKIKGLETVVLEYKKRLESVTSQERALQTRKTTASTLKNSKTTA
jgi:hypothetical protein